MRAAHYYIEAGIIRARIIRNQWERHCTILCATWILLFLHGVHEGRCGVCSVQARLLQGIRVFPLQLRVMSLHMFALDCHYVACVCDWARPLGVVAVINLSHFKLIYRTWLGISSRRASQDTSMISLGARRRPVDWKGRRSRQAGACMVRMGRDFVDAHQTRAVLKQTRISLGAHSTTPRAGKVHACSR